MTTTLTDRLESLRRRRDTMCLEPSDYFEVLTDAALDVIGTKPLDQWGEGEAFCAALLAQGYAVMARHEAAAQEAEALTAEVSQMSTECGEIGLATGDLCYWSQPLRRRVRLWVWRRMPAARRELARVRNRAWLDEQLHAALCPTCAADQGRDASTPTGDPGVTYRCPECRATWSESMSMERA